MRDRRGWRPPLPPEVRFVSDHLRLVASPGGARESLLRLLSRAPTLLDPDDLRAVFSAPGGPEGALRNPDEVPDLSAIARERLGHLSGVLARLEAEMAEADSLGAFVERTVEVTGLGHEVRVEAATGELRVVASPEAVRERAGFAAPSSGASRWIPWAGAGG